MSIKMKYDLATNCGTAKKVIGETNYYIGVSKICPRCDKAIVGYPALSRKDNRTEICSNCGNLEALEDLLKYKEQKSEKELQKPIRTVLHSKRCIQEKKIKK